MPTDPVFEDGSEWEWVLRMEKNGEVEEDTTMEFDTPLVDLYKKSMEMMEEFQLSWEKELLCA